MVTFKAVHPVEVQDEIIICRKDLQSDFDEADYVIPQQVNAATREGKHKVKVISADTDVFVLLCWAYVEQDWAPCEVVMEPFLASDKFISIADTVKEHRAIIPSLISLHSISGCDTVPMMYGVGKIKALAVGKKMPLEVIGDADADTKMY